MVGNYKFLHKALGNNAELEKEIFSYYCSNIRYLQYLDNLIGELYQNACKGLDVKISETSSEIDKFQDLVSELEFARYFCRKKMETRLLSEHAFSGRKVPDMHVIRRHQEYFVEVKNIQRDDLDFILGQKIAEIMNSRSLSYAVIISTSPRVSTPTYTYQTRDSKKQYVETALMEFVNKLDSFKNRMIPNQIETNYVDVELTRTNKGRSYLAIGTMREAICQAPDYKQRIKYDILNKAQKRNAWIGDELNKFYILAIDDNSLPFTIDNYNGEFFGDATTYFSGKVPAIDVSQDIKTALKNGWKEYLKKMSVLPNNITVIPNDRRGLCLTDSTTKNLTAILVKNGETFYFLANPFADLRINSPEILKIFKDCHVGWEP